MKNICKLFIGVLTLGTITSCEDYLDVPHYDILPEDYMFQSEENVLAGLYGLYDTFYTDQVGSGDDDAVWGFKPQVFAAGHATMDCQASGWDAEWQRHAWQPSKGSLETAWRMSYRAVDRVNRFLSGLEDVDPSIFSDSSVKTLCEAQARAIRGFNYLYLTKLFGRIPILLAGETYTTSTGKARAETLSEVYDIIEEDLIFARDVLDWEPLNGQYGHITKGFCKAYLAEVYMLSGDFTKAKSELKDIIDSNVYALEPCFANLQGWDNHWTKESVWEIMYHEQDYMGWGANADSDAMMWYGWMCAAPEWGGWGSLCLSWEYVRSFEAGDKRLQYSAVAGSEEGAELGINIHPIASSRQHPVEVVGTLAGYTGHFQGSENMPTVYTFKYWRKDPNDQVYCPISLTFKRYAGILLDYAECSFETGDASTGWDMIAQVRNRAWGYLESDSYGGWIYETLNDTLSTTTNELIKKRWTPGPMYPEEGVPDAEKYYTTYKSEKGYTSDVWKVALIQERRHEFNAEFSLYHDLCRMGMCSEWFACEYPYTASNSSQEWCLENNYSFRYFDHQPYQELFPIPESEILTNPLLNQDDQNPGY